MSSSALQHESLEEHHGLKEKTQHPFPHLREKLRETHLYDVKIKATNMKHKIGKFGNLFNRNHRHDEEQEKKTDEKRSRICENHRFNSFAPERHGNEIKWYVDGRDYFWVRSYIRWGDPGKWLMGCRLCRLHSIEPRRRYTSRTGGFPRSSYVCENSYCGSD